LKKYYYDQESEYTPEEKYLYLLLYAPGSSGRFNEKIKGSTWLQKQMHVLSKFIKEPEYGFDEHNFGVFSPALDTIKVQNTASEMINQSDEEGPLNLTEKGVNVSEKLWKKASESEKTIITDLKAFLNDMDYWDLIAFSYSTFPETTSKSEIRPEFHKHRIHAAVNLFKKQKVTVNKAASIAGMDVEEFLEELKKRKIPAYSTSKTDFEKSLKLLENLT